MAKRPDKVEVFKDAAGRWWWHRKSGNGQVIANSAEGYVDRKRAVEMAERVNGGEWEWTP